MFDSLQERLGSIFTGLTGRGALSAKDVSVALREVRRALIEADVALDIVRSFIKRVQDKAVGAEIIRSIKPGELVVKIVHDELIEMLGHEAVEISLKASAPVVLMMVGLQGSGKTTTTAKLARSLTLRKNKKVLMASLDTFRPAAQEQLRQLGEQLGILTLPVDSEESPIAIASHALERAKLCGQDVVILDTAGRTHIDQALMQEIREIRRKVLPHEILLVADSLTGQDAVNIARSFDQYLGITGIILTRMDGDGRGGAALSMRAVTGMPIKAIGTGEKLDALEGFYPRRIADRILGMGDIVSFVEKASETVNLDKAKTIARKMQEGRFDLSDLAEQLRQMQRLGGMSNIISFLPGMRGLKNKIFSGLDESLFKRYISIISSMTLEERAHPEILKHSRKKRISKGSGTNSSEINQLLKMHKKMAELIKVMGKQRGIKGLKGVFGGLISGENRHMDANSLRVLQDVGFPGLPRKK